MRLGATAEDTVVTLVRECKVFEEIEHPPKDPRRVPDIREVTFAELQREYELTGRRSTLRYMT
jgi:hypothetical protein